MTSDLTTRRHRFHTNSAAAPPIFSSSYSFHQPPTGEIQSPESTFVAAKHTQQHISQPPSHHPSVLDSPQTQHSHGHSHQIPRSDRPSRHDILIDSISSSVMDGGSGVWGGLWMDMLRKKEEEKRRHLFTQRPVGEPMRVKNERRRSTSSVATDDQSHESAIRKPTTSKHDTNREIEDTRRKGSSNQPREQPSLDDHERSGGGIRYARSARRSGTNSETMSRSVADISEAKKWDERRQEERRREEERSRDEKSTFNSEKDEDGVDLEALLRVLHESKIREEGLEKKLREKIEEDERRKEEERRRETEEQKEMERRLAEERRYEEERQREEEERRKEDEKRLQEEEQQILARKLSEMERHLQATQSELAETRRAMAEEKRKAEERRRIEEERKKIEEERKKEEEKRKENERKREEKRRREAEKKKMEELQKKEEELKLKELKRIEEEKRKELLKLEEKRLKEKWLREQKEKQEEEERRKEEIRKEEEMRRMEEERKKEQIRKEEEVKRKEEEVKREKRRLKKERKLMEEARRILEEEKRRDEDRKREAERTKMEEERRKQEEQKEEERRRLDETMREEDRKRWEEEKKMEAQIRQEEEQRRLDEQKREEARLKRKEERRARRLNESDSPPSRIKLQSSPPHPQPAPQPEKTQQDVHSLFSEQVPISMLPPRFDTFYRMANGGSGSGWNGTRNETTTLTIEDLLKEGEEPGKAQRRQFDIPDTSNNYLDFTTQHSNIPPIERYDLSTHLPSQSPHAHQYPPSSPPSPLQHSQSKEFSQPTEPRSSKYVRNPRFQDESQINRTAPSAPLTSSSQNRPHSASSSYRRQSKPTVSSFVESGNRVDVPAVELFEKQMGHDLNSLHRAVVDLSSLIERENKRKRKEEKSSVSKQRKPKSQTRQTSKSRSLPNRKPNANDSTDCARFAKHHKPRPYRSKEQAEETRDQLKTELAIKRKEQNMLWREAQELRRVQEEQERMMNVSRDRTRPDWQDVVPDPNSSQFGEQMKILNRKFDSVNRTRH
ncbi:hypothetical protein BLNAU_8892 [Blattamonas nauphoetae]|uniref:Uncharacterized protein n=1 Tax=Blattamonas nauphoetae TaxID=2049346 RepID=A0ABQ9XX97_9EUKA|nr:hypothetical protein BLNAU_8892 [Blattamonas nauphoetae]